MQCRINCSCQVEKLDIATSLLLLYQYFATVPVLVFCFNSVKSNLCQLHILILLSWDNPKIYETETEEEVDDMLDWFQFWVFCRMFKRLDGHRWMRQNQNSRLTSRWWVGSGLDTFGEKQEGDCSSIVGSAVPPANLLTWYRSRVEFSSRPVFALSFSFPTLGLEVALSYNSCCDRYELALPLIPTHKLLTWRTHLQQVRLMFLPAGPTTEQGQQEKGRNLRSTLLSND